MASAITDRRVGLTADKGIKAPVQVATTANIALSGEQTIDGVFVRAFGSGGYPDRVLVKNQSNPVQNGIYDVATGPWTRAQDANGSQDWASGSAVVVAGGTQASQFLTVLTQNPIIPGTTPITFSTPNPNLAVLAAPSGASFIGGGVRVVSSISSLRGLLKTSPASTAIVTGYYAAGDGGGGPYWCDASDTTSTDNGGSIIVASDGGRWKLLHQGPVTARQFGVKADGVTDDIVAMNNAIASLPVTGGTIDCRDCAVIAISLALIIGNGTTTTASTRNGVTLLGAGGSDVFAGTGTTLKWIGATGGTTTVCAFLGSMIGGGLLGNWIIDPNGKASHGLYVNHLVDGDFGNINIKQCTGIACNLSTQTSPDPYGGCRNNQFKSLSINSVPSGGTGLKMDGILTIPGNILQNRFDILEINNMAQNGATGLLLGWADFNVFDLVDITGTAGGTSVGVLFQGQDSTHVSFQNKFGCFANNMGMTTFAGQKPYGNFIEVFDYADSNVTIPTATGVCGFSNLYAPGPGHILSHAFGFQSFGFDTTTPAVPAAGIGNAVTNTNTYPVSIYLTPASGSNVPGVHIIDQHGSDSAIGPPLYLKLRPGEKVYFAASAPGAWTWYGDVF
jgi:hypothetical protein